MKLTIMSQSHTHVFMSLATSHNIKAATAMSVGDSRGSFCDMLRGEFNISHYTNPKGLFFYC